MSDESLELDELEPTERKKGGALIVVAAIAAAGAGAFLGLQFIGPMVGTTLASEPGAESTESGGGGDHGEEGGGGAATQVHIIDNLIVNPAQSGGTRFLIASIALAPGAHGTVEDLAARDVELRDAMLRLLGSKTVEVLSDITQRDALTREMLTTLTEKLGDGAVARVFLPQFMIQ